jgi:hypothetical protein
MKAAFTLRQLLLAGELGQPLVQIAVQDSSGLKANDATVRQTIDADVADLLARVEMLLEANQSRPFKGNPQT